MIVLDKGDDHDFVKTSAGKIRSAPVLIRLPNLYQLKQFPYRKMSLKMSLLQNSIHLVSAIGQSLFSTLDISRGNAFRNNSQYINTCQILKVAHAPGMPGTLSPPPRVSDPDMHHDTCVTHVPWSLTSGFLWSRWWGKRSRHSQRMRSPQFYVSGEGPVDLIGVTGEIQNASRWLSARLQYMQGSLVLSHRYMFLFSPGFQSSNDFIRLDKLIGCLLSSSNNSD